METPIRVLVVAAYPAVRAGLRAMLDGVDGLTVAGAVQPADLDSIDTMAADLLVIDLGDGGGRLPGSIADLLTTLPAVLLAHRPRDFHGLLGETTMPRALLLSEAGAEEIAAAAHAVARGLVVLDPAVASEALESHATVARDDDGRPIEPLTEREREVLELLALGLPNKAIALRLGISDHTVKFHVGAILAKLGAAGRTEAVMLAARRGLLTL